MSWLLDGRPLRRILLTRLRYLGDIAMSTALIGALRAGDPELEIGYLCEAAHGPLLSDHPELAHLHLLGARRRGADARARAGAGGAGLGTAAMVLALRRARYDLAVDLFFNPRSAWLLRLAGIPRRIGGATSGRRRLYTHAAPVPDAAADPDFRRHAPGGLGDHLARLFPLVHGESGASFRDFLLAGSTPRPRVAAPASGLAAARDALAGLGLDPGASYALLAPGATWPFKEWPAGHWRAFAPLLAEGVGLPLVLLRPPLRAGIYARTLADLPSGAPGGALPALPLDAALQVTAGAALTVCVDGGIMHASVALGRPTLALFGPTAPEIWFPYEALGPYRVLCRPPHCHPCDVHVCDEFICLPAITPAEAAAAAARLHAEAQGEGP